MKQQHEHPKHQEGMILLVTLLILSLLSLFIVSGLQTVFFYYQSANQRAVKKEAFHDLEFNAQQLVDMHLIGQRRCLVSGQDVNKIIQQVRIKGCVLKDKTNKYRYLIEELEQYPCLQTFKKKKRYSTKHWRINLLTAAPNELFLQIRIAHAIPLITCPIEKVNYIPQGVLSWRYLTEFK